MLKLCAAFSGAACIALSGAGVCVAQGGSYDEAQVRQINCVAMGVMAATDEADLIGTLALSARESTYNAEMLDDKLAPFVSSCSKQYKWTPEQEQQARELAAISSALTSQVGIAREAGASKGDVEKVMSLADALSDAVRGKLSSGDRADDGTRAALATQIRDAGLAPADGVLSELVYVLELAARSRGAQAALGGRLFP